VKVIKTVFGETQAVIEIKRSRFIASVIGDVNSAGAEAFIKKIKAQYPDATHNCYAYKAFDSANPDVEIIRCSDDGEPSGTAGQPMLEVLKKRGLSDAAVVVTRYFGGIKLGAGGLVGAYTQAVSEALNKSDIIEKSECAVYEIKCGYAYLSALMKALTAFGSVNPKFGDTASLKVKTLLIFEKQMLNTVAEITSDSVAAEYVGTDYFVTHIVK
jgi:uncharacterized YigZ family protein